ncbi:putative MFS-type transporter EfpA [Streptomyces sp. YIM 121038]|uniref:MFS transporter n=1 Tax=Streptomyces sp. YIM 121038 TaxID=2136401 RepID=UPI0011659E00|nr:MFS transporter [Streptomyces sp. YIM 121038]QCX78484.1 putative MFS-type transporter EfpA [Streptomyces sp. YIM 121038]
MGARAWALLLVLCGTIFLEGADIAMLAIAIPTIRSDLDLSTATAAWVISSYVLGYAGFTLLGGRAADLLGRRRMFLTWLGVFLVFSGLGGLATEGWMLIVARFVTGVAAAFMTPAAMSIITTSYAEGPERNKALLVFAGTSAGGFSLGLVIGGLLTELGWQWVFFAPVVLAAAILAAAVRLVPAADAPAAKASATLRSGGFDLPGAAAAAGAMLLLAYGVVRLEHGLDGWPLTLGATLGGLLLGAAFVGIERRAAVPLVRLGIFRTGTVVRAGLGALLFLGAFMGFQFVLTLYLQELRGWSSWQTAIALVVMGCDVVLAPTLTPRLVNRYGHARVILGGFLLAALAYALFLPVGRDWTYAAMFPTLLIAGTSFALAYGPLMIAATDGVAAREQGLAGGILHTATQFGAAIGVSGVTAVYGLVAGGHGGTAGAGHSLDAFRAALVVPVALALVGVAVALAGVVRGGRPPQPAARSEEPAAALPVTSEAR